MANITVSPRHAHPASYVEVAGVSMAGMGPVFYAFHERVFSLQLWPALRYFAEQIGTYVMPGLLASVMVLGMAIGALFLLKRVVS